MTLASDSYSAENSGVGDSPNQASSFGDVKRSGGGGLQPLAPPKSSLAPLQQRAIYDAEFSVSNSMDIGAMTQGHPGNEMMGEHSFDMAGGDSVVPSDFSGEIDDIQDELEYEEAWQ